MRPNNRKPYVMRRRAGDSEDLVEVDVHQQEVLDNAEAQNNITGSSETSEIPVEEFSSPSETASEITEHEPIETIEKDESTGEDKPTTFDTAKIKKQINKPSVRKKLVELFNTTGLENTLTDKQMSDLSKEIETAGVDESEGGFDKESGEAEGDGELSTKDKAKVVYGESKWAIDKYKDGDVSAKDLTDGINTLFSEEGKLATTFDIGEQVAVIGLVTATLVKYDIPELADKFIDKLEDQKAKERLYEQNAFNAARSSKLGTVSYFVNKMGPGRTSAIGRELIETIISSYTRSNSETLSLKEVGDMMLELCNTIKHDWLISGGKLDLTIISSIQLDALNALKTTTAAKHAVAGFITNVERPDTTISTTFPQFGEL